MDPERYGPYRVYEQLGKGGMATVHRAEQDTPRGESVPPQRPAVNIITVKQAGEALFISTFYHGPMMLKVDAQATAW